MLVQVDDITPSGFKYVWLPNDTYDDLVTRDILAVPVLMFYARHSIKYDPTLTKLVAAAAGASKERLSRAYNVCIERRYLVRVEFGISIPAGETGRPGQRYTTMFYSRVPITDEVLGEVIAGYTPGKFVILPWGEAVPGVEREKRRVKVINAEVYSYRGTHKITRGEDGEPVLTEHAGRRGKRAERAPRTAPVWTPPMANRTAQIVPETAPEPPVGPKVENPTSGPTSANTIDPQVAPEVDHPEFGCSTSIKKDQENDQENDQGNPDGSAVAPDALRLSGPNTSTATGQRGPDPMDHLTGDQQTARANETDSGPGRRREIAPTPKYVPPVPPPPPVRTYRPRPTPREVAAFGRRFDPADRAAFREQHAAATGGGAHTARTVADAPEPEHRGQHPGDATACG